MRIIGGVLIGASLAVAARECAAAEDIEFVAEHLAEVAMDNRYATLPIWGNGDAEHRDTHWQLQSAYSSATSGNLEIHGPLFAASIRTQMTDAWRVGAFAFYDPLQLDGESEQRPLQTLFAPANPIDRPVAAEFDGLSGTADDYGLGFYAAYERTQSWMGKHDWVVGALWQGVELSDYRFDYRVIEGPQADTTGQIDFDATYEHIVPFVGFELPRDYGPWSTSAHALLAWPIPRRGVVGHITGPGFDIHGDPSLTIGYTVTYRPAGVSIDIGTLLMQSLLEPRIHRGVEQTLLLSFSFSMPSGK
jgi:hypothetical protein